MNAYLWINMFNSSCIPFSPYIYRYLLEAGYTHLLVLSKPEITEEELTKVHISYLLPLKQSPALQLGRSGYTITALATLDMESILVDRTCIFRVLLLPDGVINMKKIIAFPAPYAIGLPSL